MADILSFYKLFDLVKCFIIRLYYILEMVLALIYFISEKHILIDVYK